MKKILSSVAAIALAAALISCGDSGDTNNTITNSDTIISVGTPVVTGKAYPGVNYITWTPVANASYYEVYRTVNNASELVASNVTGKLEFADFAKANASSDFALVDGVTYQYTIYAVGANGVNVPSRAVYIATSTASTYVKATVPAYGTDITKFDDQTTKDYLAKLAKGEGVTKPALLDSTTFAATEYNVSFAYPVIPGYKYAVNLVRDDYVAKGVEITTGEKNQKKATSGFTANFNGTYTANGGKIAKGSGKYTAYLTVAALSPLYTTDAVYALGEITIADIGELTNTSNVKASYSGEKNVVVTWTPAKLKSTGADTPVANYRVFRASSADDYNTLTQIDTATNKVFVAEQENAYQTTINGQTATVSTLYAIKDTVTDNKVTYRYYAVHTNGTLYGKEASYATLSAYSNVNGKTSAPSLSVTTIKADASHIYDTFKIKATPVNVNLTNNLSKVTEIAYIKLDDDTIIGTSKEKVYDPSAFTALKLENSNLSDGSYIAYLEAKDGTYLFRAKAEETGKDPAYSYQTIVMAASANAGTLTTWLQSYTLTNTTTGTTTYPYVFAVKENSYNEIGAYDYEWFYVDTTTANYNYGDKVTVTTSSLSKVTPTKVTSDSSTGLQQTVGVGNYGFIVDYTAPTFSGDTRINRQYFVKKTNKNNTAVYGIR